MREWGVQCCMQVREREKGLVYVVSVFVGSLAPFRTEVASGPSRHYRKRGCILLVFVPIFYDSDFRYFKSIYVVYVLYAVCPSRHNRKKGCGSA